jgi:hypothetical protein
MRPHLLTGASSRARFLALGILLGAAACGDDDDDPSDDAADDAADDTDGDGEDDGGDPTDDASDGADDGGSACAWQLAPATAPIEFLEADPGPFNPDRTARVKMQTELASCEELAIPRVDIDEDAATAVIELRVFRSDGNCAGPPRTITRSVALRLPSVARWTVTAGDQSVELDVEASPERACGADAPCAMDCDCADGLRCLSGSGIAGPFTECGRPCELDRDCGGQGICESIADGLAFACLGDPECSDDRPCPKGWRCDGGACAPGFTLDQDARRECACDDDCESPLRCTRAGADQPGRCEIACPTEGPWCQGAHVCGEAEMDTAGLAETDSVCVFLGE